MTLSSQDDDGLARTGKEKEEKEKRIQGSNLGPRVLFEDIEHQKETDACCRLD